MEVTKEAVTPYEHRVVCLVDAGRPHTSYPTASVATSRPSPGRPGSTDSDRRCTVPTGSTSR